MFQLLNRWYLDHSWVLAVWSRVFQVLWILSLECRYNSIPFYKLLWTYQLWGLQREKTKRKCQFIPRRILIPLLFYTLLLPSYYYSTCHIKSIAESSERTFEVQIWVLSPASSLVCGGDPSIIHTEESS